MKTLKIIQYIIVWRLFLFAVLALSLSTFSLQFNFIGGGVSSYLKNPYLWGWINFDGEHYLSIAQNGYHALEYFFFPLYPTLTRYVAFIIGRTPLGFAFSGLIVSHVALLIGLIGLVKLITLDYPLIIAKRTILLFLLFPTSFFFGGYFTESLFFALVVWSFYFLRHKNWFLSGLLGAFASGTRLVGIALIPALLIEGYLHEKRIFSKSMAKAVITSGITLLGLGIYMFFLYKRTGDPIAFFTSLNSVFGDQRSDSIILLPQVFYRYIFKILPALNYSYFPQVFTAYLEIATGIVFLVLSIISFFKLRMSYGIYALGAYIIPTLSGSFSSFPRYVLAIFPAFILMSIGLTKLSPAIRGTVYVVFAILLSLATSLFLRGYWIS